MTARDEVARLLFVEGHVPGMSGTATAFGVLDAIARLATDPETAPVVFRWLVEAGVLAESEVDICTIHNGTATEWDVCEFAPVTVPAATCSYDRFLRGTWLLKGRER